MPCIGKWGTFIHIPKTGGTFVTQCLLKTGPRDGNARGTHHLPTYWKDHNVWTSVREPCEWLASVWAHRDRQAWRRYGPETPWGLLCDFLADYKDGRWPKFVEKIMGERPGLIGWFFGIYTPPGVVTYKLGPELYQHLRDLGADPDAEGTQVNVGHNVPEITQEQREIVYNAEKATYERYGFPNPTSKRST